jgi:hypothetical protein
VSADTAGTDTASAPSTEATGTTTEAQLVGGAFTPWSSIGGGGGGGPYWLGCDWPQVVMGLFGHSGATTDQLGVVCANLNPDGTIQSQNWPQRWVGGNGGNYFQVLCPPNEFATGVDLYYDSTDNGIWLNCQTAAQVRSGNTNPDAIPVVENWSEYAGRYNCNWAGWDGHRLNPPGPAALSGFYAKAASYIDALSPICVPLNF